MGDKNTQGQEAARLERLWAGEFGMQYIERNKNAANKRDAFWKKFLKKYPVKNALEVGCNVGANLHWIAQVLPPKDVYGIDINPAAVETVKKNIPGVNATLAGAKKLPYPDGRFELTFTAGVLIHQPEESLGEVMSEVFRLSGRYVLCMEYFSEKTVEIPYRDQSGALFKRPYGELYQKAFPSLQLLEEGWMGKDEGWDDITWWVFEKK